MSVNDPDPAYIHQREILARVMATVFHDVERHLEALQAVTPNTDPWGAEQHTERLSASLYAFDLARDIYLDLRPHEVQP